MSTWQYSQESGQLSKDSKLVATGYSGKGEHKNNPDSQHIKNYGPIPQGDWKVTKLEDKHEKLGPHVLHLEPDKGTNTYGRDAFRIHGDSKAHPGDASNGCIVVGPAARDEIKVGDKVKVTK